MLNMESYVGSMVLGEESLQMWDLNKRLEVYLTRVKSLEEENEFLRAEIQSLKGNRPENSWRTKYEEEISALRATLEESFSKKSELEMARDNLYEEIEYVKSRCQKERLAQEEAKKQLSESKKMLEEEGRAQIWLKEKAIQLEKELETLLEVHEQEKAGLEQEMVTFSQKLENFRVAPMAFQPVEVEDYSKQLSEIWKGAVETYKNEVSVLEVHLSEAKEKLWKVVEENRQNQLQLQSLEKELVSLKMQKEILEEHLSKEWQNQQQEAEKFQLDIESLEQEKQNLRVQIAQILEDRQQLMHLKMSLSLEVATYRTLLEAESTRLQVPLTDYKLATTFRETKNQLNSSKLQTVNPEARRSAFREYRLSSIPVQREARRAPPEKVPNVFFNLNSTVSPKGGSPVTREFQKVNSVLQSHSLKYTSASGLRKDTPIKTEKGQEPPKSDEIITKAKAEATSMTFSQDLSVPDAMPPVVLETDILSSPDTVPYSETEQAESCLEMQAHQAPVEEFPKETIEGNKEDQIPYGNDEKLNGETMTDSLSIAQLVTKTLEVALKEVKESDGDFNPFHPFSPDVDPSLLKAKEAGYDLSPYDQEMNGNGHSHSTHVEMIQEEQVQGLESQMPTSIQASKTDPAKEVETPDDAPSDEGHYLENGSQEADTGNSEDVEISHPEKGEGSMKAQDITKQKIEVVSDIPFTNERCEADPCEDVRSFQHAAVDREEPKLLSTGNEEEPEVISKYVAGTLSKDLRIPQGAEWNSHEISRSDQDTPSSTEVDLEKLDAKDSDFELSATRVSEDEKTEELASIVEGHEDYSFEAQSEEQEDNLLRTGMQADEVAKHYELFLSETEEKLPQASRDQIIVEQDEKSKQVKLVDKKDIDVENAADITELTSAQKTESPFTHENLDITKDSTTEGLENVDLKDDVVGQENQAETSNALGHEDLKVDESILEKENADFIEGPFGQDTLGHETVVAKESALKLKAVGSEEVKEENCQRWLSTESDSKREESKPDHFETGEARNIDFSHKTTWEDVFVASAEMKDHSSDSMGSLDSELRVITDKEEVKDDAEDRLPKEYRNPAQEKETITSFAQEEEYMDITREYIEDQSFSIPGVKETSDPENREKQIVTLHESQKTEQYKEVPTSLKVQEEFHEEQNLGDSALRSMDYQSKHEYSEAEAQDEESLNELHTSEIKEQELEISKDYTLEQTLPDTTCLPSFDDEKVNLVEANKVMPVTEDNKDDDVYLCTEGTIDSVSTSEEFPFSLQGTQHQTDNMSSSSLTASKVEEDMGDALELISNKGTEVADHIPYEYYQGMHDSDDSEASDGSLARDELSVLKDDKNIYSEHNLSETMIDRLVPEMSPNKVTVSKQKGEEADSLANKSDDDVEIVLEETEDNEESKVKKSHPEMSEHHDLSFALELKQDDFSKEHDSINSETDDVEIMKESTLNLNYSSYAEAESTQGISAVITLGDILQRDEALQVNEKDKIVNPDSEGLVSSNDKEEESPTVTRTDYSSELDLGKRGHPDGKNGLDEANQCDDVRNSSSPSQELEDKSYLENMKNCGQLPTEKQDVDFHTDLLSSSVISNQSFEAEHPVQEASQRDDVRNASSPSQELEDISSSENVKDCGPTEKQADSFHSDLLSSSDISNQSYEAEHPTQEASQCDDVISASSPSQELEDISSSENVKDCGPTEKQADSFHSDLLSSSDISNQFNEAEHPTQNEDIAEDQQQVSSDSLFNTSEIGEHQEQVVQHSEKTLMSEMEFTIENNFDEKNNSGELNALHTEMLNGYSYLEQSNKTVVDDQSSTEKLNGDIMSTSGEEGFAETVFTQDLHKDKILLFPTSEVKGDGLFQTLLETSDKEAKQVDEVLFLASDDEETQHSSEDNRCPEAKGFEDDLSNIIEAPYVKGKYVHDQHHRTETNQHGTETLGGLGTKFRLENEDTWSSEDD